MDGYVFIIAVFGIAFALVALRWALSAAVWLSGEFDEWLDDVFRRFFRG